MNLKKILAVTILFPAFIGAMDPSIKRGTASSSASSSSSNSAPREYVDFQDKDIPYIESIYAGHEQKKMIDITYLVGNNFNYYKGYRAKRIKENVVSFPLEACTPIPFKIYGDLHYFISSAVRGTNLRHATGFWGSGYEITDPNITRVVAVRGKTEGGRWSQIYLGLDAGEKKGKNIIYNSI